VPTHVAEDDDVFILRFWRESSGDTPEPTRWRARITEVRTKRQIHAEGIEAAFNIVRSLLLKGKTSARRPRPRRLPTKEIPE
jgi:hypothetical protein